MLFHPLPIPSLFTYCAFIAIFSTCCCILSPLCCFVELLGVSSFINNMFRRRKKVERQKAVYRLVTVPQGGTQKYTLAFAYDSPR